MRIETIGDATLYLARCEDILPILDSVDALVTDPPYGIGQQYESHVDSRAGYIDWLWPILEQAESKLTPGSPVFVWQAAPNIRYFGSWFPRDWRLFVAAKNFVQMRKTAMQWSYDPVVTWWTPGAVPWYAGTSSKDFHVGNTAAAVSKKGAIEKGHPCPRPLDTVAKIVQQWCRPGGVVLDLFMGSGTMGVACVANDRRFIGVEMEPKYFDIACARIHNATEGKASEEVYEG